MMKEFAGGTGKKKKGTGPRVKVNDDKRAFFVAVAVV